MELNLASKLHNNYSQNGEDGIIEALYEAIIAHQDLLSKIDLTAIEFGAWDGLHLSNVANIIKSHNVRGIFIEASKKRFHKIKKNFPESRHILINEFVELEGKNSIDELCSKHLKSAFPLIMSIDIDGMDYWVLDSMKSIQPIILVVEYNPTIPFTQEYINPKSFSEKKGSSALSIFKLAKNKNYELVAITNTNLIFLEKSTFEKIKVQNVSDLQNIATEFGIKCESILIYCGYDGSLLASDDVKIQWHGISRSKSNVKALPKIFQVFPEDFSKYRKILFYIFYRMWLIKSFGLKLSIKKIKTKYSQIS